MQISHIADSRVSIVTDILTLVLPIMLIARTNKESVYAVNHWHSQTIMFVVFDTHIALHPKIP